MSAEPLPSPGAAPARSRRAEGLSRSVLGRPVLSLVAAPDRARRAPFVALVLGILLAGLVGLLLLTTASAQDAFRLHRLEASASNTADTRQALSEQVNNLTNPGGLAGQAQKMGMVPMGAPEFWKPGTPLPPGARVVDGMLIVPASSGVKPAPSPTATLPAGSAGASVTSVARPGQKPAAPSTSTSGRASTKPSTKASTKPSTKPSTGASTKPSTKAGTKPSTGTAKTGSTTKTGTTKTGTTSGTATSGTQGTR